MAQQDARQAVKAAASAAAEHAKTVFKGAGNKPMSAVLNDEVQAAVAALDTAARVLVAMAALEVKD